MDDEGQKLIWGTSSEENRMHRCLRRGSCGNQKETLLKDVVAKENWQNPIIWG